MTSVLRFGRESRTRLDRSIEVPVLAIAVDPFGNRRLRATDVTHSILSVLRSVDLRSWETLGAITNAGTGGTVEFIDSTPPETQVFYRIQVP